MASKASVLLAGVASCLLAGFAALAQAPSTAELVQQLSNGDPELARKAAQAVQRQPPQAKEELAIVADAVKSALSSTRDREAEAALRLALGALAAAGVEDAAEWGFESMSVTHRPNTPQFVFEAHVKALEMVPGAAKVLMIGNLDVALNLPEVEPKERQRIKEFVTLTAEKMKTRELADFLDALLTGEDDLLAKLEAPLEARLIACYRNVKADQPIHADALAKWLEKHPGGPPEVDAVGLETVFLLGTRDPEAANQLAARMLDQPQIAVAVARRIVDGQKNDRLKPLVVAALKRHAAAMNRESAAMLARLERP